jgi:hypothetical protein
MAGAPSEAPGPNPAAGMMHVPWPLAAQAACSLVQVLPTLCGMQRRAAQQPAGSWAVTAAGAACTPSAAAAPSSSTARPFSATGFLAAAGSSLPATATVGASIDAQAGQGHVGAAPSPKIAALCCKMTAAVACLLEAAMHASVQMASTSTTSIAAGAHEEADAVDGTSLTCGRPGDLQLGAGVGQGGGDGWAASPPGLCLATALHSAPVLLQPLLGPQHVATTISKLCEALAQVVKRLLPLLPRAGPGTGCSSSSSSSEEADEPLAAAAMAAVHGMLRVLQGMRADGTDVTAAVDALAPVLEACLRWGDAYLPTCMGCLKASYLAMW